MVEFKQKIRFPAVSGEFYPENKKELERMIDIYLSQVEPFEIEGDVFGLILPHAGYVFSGQVAAYGMKAIENKNFDTAILIGDSHLEYFEGVSIWTSGYWETPLGKLEIDNLLAKKIISFSDRFFERDSTHLFEHALEVQLPFLQKTLKDFKILPIIFGSENKDWEKLAEAILENIKDKKILIITSSDLSHYLPYNQAQEIDRKTLNSIINFDYYNLDACGKDAIKTLMKISEKLGAYGKILKYLNSGDTFGDKLRVVGYGAVAFYT